MTWKGSKDPGGDALWWWIVSAILFTVLGIIGVKQCHRRSECEHRGGRYVRSQDPGSLGECVQPLPRAQPR